MASAFTYAILGRYCAPVTDCPKPTVLVFLRHFLPGFKAGGPVRSVANLISHLRDDFDFRVLCLNRDFLESEAYPSVPLRTWIDQAVARVCYVEQRDMLPWELARTVKAVSYDLVYLNSFFDPLFSISPLLAMKAGLLSERPILLAPRGEFSSGAMGLHAIRKRAFVTFSRLTGFHRRVNWQATSEEERQDILRVIGVETRALTLAPNLTETFTPAPPTSAYSRHGALRLVFLSRVSPKKNLEQAIKIVARMSTPVLFDIWGPIDDPRYWSRCEHAAAQCPGHITVRYRGPIPHDQVPQTLAQYRVFFLPTLGENFGHAIHESLASGIPVIVSDRTPWRNLQESGVGFDIALENEDGFLRALQHYAEMNDAEFARCRNACIEYASQRARCSDPVEASRVLLLKALGR